MSVKGVPFSCDAFISSDISVVAWQKRQSDDLLFYWQIWSELLVELGENLTFLTSFTVAKTQGM